MAALGTGSNCSVESSEVETCLLGTEDVSHALCPNSRGCLKSLRPLERLWMVAGSHHCCPVLSFKTQLVSSACILAEGRVMITSPVSSSSTKRQEGFVTADGGAGDLHCAKDNTMQNLSFPSAGQVQLLPSLLDGCKV